MTAISRKSDHAFSIRGGLVFGKTNTHLCKARGLRGIAGEFVFLERVGFKMKELLQFKIRPLTILPILAHQHLRGRDEIHTLDDYVLVEKLVAPGGNTVEK